MIDEGSENEYDKYDYDDIVDEYNEDDEEDELLSDSFSDIETSDHNWRVERLHREEYLAVC